jgi:alpha-beta hydrolase superfamily lysophospholipase
VKLTVDGVTVGATISIPKSDTIASVVFLAGSGPTDTDSTMEPNKPLKDLAWGLASKGIAISRWDEVSAETSKVAADEDMTLQKEYLKFSEEALKALQKSLSSKGKADLPIFVLGHSLGGMVAPLFALTNANIKGIILLSAGAGKMHDSALRQMQYLASLDRDPPLVTTEFLNVVSKQVALVSSSEMTAQLPREDMPLGAPASYWISVKNYDQLETANIFDGPIFIGQGERDFQVSASEDVAAWQKVLARKKGYMGKLYHGIGHLLIDTGFEHVNSGILETPDDHTLEGHVAGDVLDDIYSWVKEQC